MQYALRTHTLVAVLFALTACGEDAPMDLEVPLALETDEDIPLVVEVPAEHVTAETTYAPTPPAHGNLTGEGSSFTYMPAANYAGPDSFNIVVTAGRTTTTIHVTVTVHPVNDAPLAVAQDVSTSQDVSAAIVLEGTDEDSTSLTYAIATQPQHGALTGAAPALTYVPSEGFNGEDSFTFTVSDGTLTSAEATVNVYVAGCGSGVLDQDEVCDDGNGDDTDACPRTCAEAYCGDGFVRAGVELCDDGDGDDDDECPTTCAAATCGDGFVQAGVEECDDGRNGDVDACLDTCMDAFCGDGFTRAGVELCDDGNTSATDGCTDACEPARCGDGHVYAGIEECDDGDASNGPGQRCNAACVLNICGDGDVGPGEQCDDGNVNGGDGCSATCELET